MFSVPKYGWVNISIGDWSDRASYLTDPHLDMLDAFITLYKGRNPGAVFCDAEGWDFIIVISFNDVFVIEQKDEPKLYNFDALDIRIRALCEEVIEDIEGHLYEWSLWDFNVEDEATRVKSEEKIKSKLSELREALEDYDNRHRSRRI